MPEILDEEELKKIRNATLLVSVFYLAAGILLIIFNSQVKEVIGYAIGAAAIAIGAWRLILYAASHRKKSLIATDLFAGCVLIALGILCLIFQARMVDYVAIIFGILLLVGSAVEMQNAIDLKQMSAKRWWIILLLGFVSLALGVLLIVYPAFIRQKVMLLSGIFFTYDGATGLVAAIWSAGRFHSMKKSAAAGGTEEETDSGSEKEEKGQEDVYPDEDADLAEYEPISEEPAENEGPADSSSVSTESEQAGENQPDHSSKESGQADGTSSGTEGQKSEDPGKYVIIQHPLEN